MHLLSIPAEVRLQILSELLVQEGTIHFDARYGPRNPRLIRTTQGLFSTLLRVCKKINQEAIRLLYSNNRFQFPNAFTTSWNTDVPYIASFVQQIGSNASFLRSIRLDFPTSFADRKAYVLYKEYIDVLQLIRDTCTNLKTIEISSLELPIWDVDSAAGMLKAIDDGGLKEMHSLEEIIVIQGEHEIDDEIVADCEALRHRVPSIKWLIELRKLPPRIWISADDRVEYEEEVIRREQERFEREEDEQWLEEYYRRRNDPYWKNDSDYD
ncbi:unnamed protein product [Clonostachys solani]|uniref:Uncharacterized protein n=1 Tax=Clonostachys solani TaxID=160281 RepID=A0A9N9W799_9HYPO|nr:unnamed protein product [Clonostachys solani]